MIDDWVDSAKQEDVEEQFDHFRSIAGRWKSKAHMSSLAKKISPKKDQSLEIKRSKSLGENGRKSLNTSSPLTQQSPLKKIDEKVGEEEEKKDIVISLEDSNAVEKEQMKEIENLKLKLQQSSEEFQKQLKQILTLQNEIKQKDLKIESLQQKCDQIE